MHTETNPGSPPVLIDKKAMNVIKDYANRIWRETRKPNANVCMLQALRDYLEQQGVKANFVIDPKL